MTHQTSTFLFACREREFSPLLLGAALACATGQHGPVLTLPHGFPGGSESTGVGRVCLGLVPSHRAASSRRGRVCSEHGRRAPWGAGSCRIGPTSGHRGLRGSQGRRGTVLPGPAALCGGDSTGGLPTRRCQRPLLPAPGNLAFHSISPFLRKSIISLGSNRKPFYKYLKNTSVQNFRCH